MINVAVAQVGGGDQCGAVVAAGGELGARAFGQQHAQGLLVVGHSGDGDRVVAVVVERGMCRPGFHQRLHRAALSGEGGHVQWRAAVAIARFESRFVLVGQALDRHHVAMPGRARQSAVGRHLGSVGRHLGPCAGGADGEQCDASRRAQRRPHCRHADAPGGAGGATSLQSTPPVAQSPFLMS